MRCGASLFVMHHYAAFGLHLASVLALPDWPERRPGTDPDVVLRRGILRPPPLVETDGRCRCAFTADGAYLAWPDAGTFWIAPDGRQVVYHAVPRAAEQAVRLYLQGAVLGTLLILRGRFVLHGSAVDVGGRAVVLVGEKGWGKSTTAGALHRRGCGLVTDDLAMVDLPAEGPPRLVPGLPQLKLWPESVKALGWSDEPLERLHPDYEKRARSVAPPTTPSLPIHAVYVLTEGPRVARQALPMRLALGASMRHWYGARFGRHLLDHLDLEAHFLHCATLCRRVPVVRLDRPYNLGALDDVVDLILSDAAS